MYQSHIYKPVSGDLNGSKMRVNTVDVTDIRSVGVETINVHASTVVTDGLNANVEAIDVHTQGITSNDMKTRRPYELVISMYPILSRPVLSIYQEHYDAVYSLQMILRSL
jgi:hypothetical protein